MSPTPTLTSNSFLLTLTTRPHSRLTPIKPPRRLAVQAKKSAGLRPFSRPDDGGEGEPDDRNPFGFSFDFGKVSEMKALIPVVNRPSAAAFGRRKDANTVFVVGATGLVGIRIAQTLLREGFSVRAGVPDLGAAQDLARLAVNYQVISSEESKRLNAVESTFQDAESIAKAIGNATKAVVTIGPAENGPKTGLTTLEALQFIQGAQLAGVRHVAIVYDASPAVSTNNVLDGISIFFTNLFSKSQPLAINEFLDGIVETDVNYTLIKTSLTEDYTPESNYNVVVAAEGSVGAGANDYKVGRSKIASMVADVLSNTDMAENKVVEVSAAPDAAAKPVSVLFSAIPEDGRRKAYAEAIAKAKAEEEAARAAERAAEAAEAAQKLGEEVKKLEQQEVAAASLAKEAQEKATAAGTAVAGFMGGFKMVKEPKEAGGSPKVPGGSGPPAVELSWEKLSSRFASAVKNPIEMPKVQIATVRGQAKAQGLQAKQAFVKKPMPKAVPKKEPKEKGSKPEVRKLFGGMFQQETIYVDD